MHSSGGLHDTVSSAIRTSLERERGRKRERERERAQRDRHARSTRRFLRSHYEITVCDRIASNCSVWDPPKFDFEVEVVSPFNTVILHAPNSSVCDVRANGNVRIVRDIVRTLLIRLQAQLTSRKVACSKMLENAIFPVYARCDECKHGILEPD